MSEKLREYKSCGDCGKKEFFIVEGTRNENTKCLLYFWIREWATEGGRSKENFVEGGMKDAQKLLKDMMRRKQTRREKQSRVKNAMASKEYYMESPHLMLARNIFKNSVSKSLPA